MSIPTSCSTSNPGVAMSILTGRELEFLSSLSTSWKRLYWNELARLLKEDDGGCDARHEPHSAAAAIWIRAPSAG